MLKRSDARSWSAGLGLALLALVAVACGGDEPAAAPSPTPADTPTLAGTPTPTVSAARQAFIDAALADKEASEAIGLDIRTVLPRDAIPAILSPRFVSGEEAAAQMSTRELVIGLSINGDHRAYATSQLSSHEVVNDVVGGRPIMVTW